MSPEGDAAGAVRAVTESIRRHATYSLGREWRDLSPRELLTAVALSVRDRLTDGLLRTEERCRRTDPKRVCYLSIEFLLGRSLGSNLLSLGLRERYEEALRELGADLAKIEETEEDAALGNGGLGRLAACILESLATQHMPATGYGINYEFGLFKQEIDDGCQRERPDNWLAQGSPWQIARPDEACLVPIYGRIEHGTDRLGGYNPMWMDWKVLVGVPHDMLIPGHGGETVNVLRLYAARASRDFDMRIFNDGDYFKAVEQKISSETVSKVLYPADTVVGGQELRLLQEYFLVACAIRDIVRRFQHGRRDLRDLPGKVAIQMNDTHPALAVAELMRVLVDEKDRPWEEAWALTQATLGYTNHTLAPEALERWPVPLLERVVPRHLQIILEINRRLLDQVAAACPGDVARQRRMSLVEESAPKQVRMANLAIVGSHSINGVSAVHSELVQRTLVPDFHELWPERFNNKTNGITQRRWLLQANPALGELLRATIGDGWIRDLTGLRALEPWADDAGFQDAFLHVKWANKQRLAAVIADSAGVRVDPCSLFDVQVKRIHAYKRQLLNVLHVIHEYLSLVEDDRRPAVPRTYVFAGKAAPGYWGAKQTIKLIHDVGRTINEDPRARDWIRVAFVPDYRVSLAERIIPAADLSEQISTAGKEASGTGNMKLALNGAVTIGTLDGANIEILAEVGQESFFSFGLRVEEVEALRAGRSYRPRERCAADPRLQRVVGALRGSRFCPREPDRFAWIAGALLQEDDEYLHLADLPGYLDAHDRAGAAFQDRARWARMAILNVARMGRFSIDRTVSEYAGEIWGLAPVPPSAA